MRTRTNHVKTYIGIDNGVTGSIAIIYSNTIVYPNTAIVAFASTPVHKCLSYTKKKQWINRVDFRVLEELLNAASSWECFCLIERPMVNPGRFKATISALRALEATQITLERLGIPYEYIDSKEWQKAMLPSGLKGPPELKRASMEVAKRLFPQHKELITKHKDGDGLLIAEYARRQGL